MTKIANLNAVLALDTTSFGRGIDDALTKADRFGIGIDKIGSTIKAIGGDGASLSSTSLSKWFDSTPIEKITTSASSAKMASDSLSRSLDMAYASAVRIGSTDNMIDQAVAAMHRLNSSSKATASSVTQAAASGSSGFARFAPVISQAGFALQDFTSQLSTRGLGGAFAAISNNIQVMGGVFGPVGMAVSAFGGALLGVAAAPMINYLSGADEISKKNDSIKESFKSLSETAFRAIDVLSGIGSSVFSSGENTAAKKYEEITNQVGKLNIELALLARLEEKEAERRANKFERTAAEQAIVNKRQEVASQLSAAQEMQRMMSAGEVPGIKFGDVAHEQKMQSIKEEIKLEREYEDQVTKQKLEDEKRVRDEIESTLKAEEALKRKTEKETRESRIRGQEDTVENIEKQLKGQQGNKASQSLSLGGQEFAQTINRALVGTSSEADTLKKQLEVARETLRFLREQAREPIVLTMTP